MTKSRFRLWFKQQFGGLPFRAWNIPDKDKK